MKKLLLLPILALPLLFLGCDGETPTEPATPQFDVTAEGAATNTVQVKLRCAKGVTGSVTVKVESPGGDYPFYMNCVTNPIDEHTFGFNPGDVDLFWLTSQSWSFGSCGSFKPSTLYNDIPGAQKCYEGMDQKGKAYLTVRVRYIRDPS